MANAYYVMKGPVLLLQPETFEMLGRNEYPLDLAYMGASMVSNKREVQLYDFRAVQDSHRHTTVEHFIHKHPWIVVIAVAPQTIVAARQLCKRFKNANPDVTTVLTGTILKYVGRYVISEKDVDYLIFGCNESAVTHLASALENDASVHDIRGLMYRDESRIVENLSDIAVTNSTDAKLSLPSAAFMPWIANKGGKYTSRFSPKGIRFASVASSGPSCAKYGSTMSPWIMRDPGNVAAEVARLVTRLNVNHISFVDEAFPSDWHRAKGIIDVAKEKASEFTFDIVVRPEQILSQSSQLDEMVNTGLRGVELRLDFAPDFTQHRRFDEVMGDNEHALDAVRATTLLVYPSGIIWHPQSTIHDIQAICAFLINRRLFNPELLIRRFVAYPGTEVHQWLSSQELARSGYPAFEYDFSDKAVGNLFSVFKRFWPRFQNHYPDMKKLYRASQQTQNTKLTSELKPILFEARTLPFQLLEKLLHPSNRAKVAQANAEDLVRSCQIRLIDLHNKSTRLCNRLRDR